MGSKIEARAWAKEIVRPTGIRGCDYKAWFRTLTQAEQEIQKIRHRYLENGVDPRKYRRPIRAYYCERCFGYHLTSKIDRFQKKRYT